MESWRILELMGIIRKNIDDMQRELDRIDARGNNGFDALKVIRLAKGIRDTVKKIKDPQKENLLRNIIREAECMETATRRVKGAGDFWCPAYLRVSSGIITRLRAAENNYLGRIGK